MMATFLLLVIGCHSALSHHNNKGSRIGIMICLILEYVSQGTIDAACINTAAA